MTKTKLRYEKVTKNNLELAIKTQNEIFPNENGTLNLKLSINKNLVIKIFGDLKKIKN